MQGSKQEKLRAEKRLTSTKKWNKGAPLSKKAKIGGPGVVRGADGKFTGAGASDDSLETVVLPATVEEVNDAGILCVGRVLTAIWQPRARGSASATHFTTHRSIAMQGAAVWRN